MNELPEVGTIVTVIFGSKPKVIWTHKTTIEDTARNIEIAMSQYGQTNAKAKYSDIAVIEVGEQTIEEK